MKATTRRDYLDRVMRVLRHIQSHLDDELAPAALADVAHVSVYHFHRIFSGLVGESLTDHVRRLRLERAAGELRRTDARVVDVALSAGYESHEAFTRAFRSHFAVTPSAWRDRSEPITFPHVLCGVHFGPDEAVSRFVAIEEDSHMTEVRIDIHETRRLLALSHSGDYLGIGPAFGRLMAVAGARGLLGPDSQSIGIYYDNPDVVPTSELRSHACVTVPRSVTDAPEGFELIDLPAGESAVGVHRGPYSELHKTYRWLFGQWLPSSGREAADMPCYEVYVSDPQATAPEDLITWICVPLVSASVSV